MNKKKKVKFFGDYNDSLFGQIENTDKIEKIYQIGNEKDIILFRSWTGKDPKDAFGKAGFFKSLDKCSEKIRHIVLYDLWAGEFVAPWQDYDADIRSAFEKITIIVNKTSEISAAINKAISIPPRWAIEKIRILVRNLKIYSVIREYTHNQKKDLTNRFFAPARIMGYEDKNKYRDIWRNEFSGTLKKIQSDLRSVFETEEDGINEIDEAINRIEIWLNQANAEVEIDSSLERVMELFTKIRQDAGESIGPLKSEPDRIEEFEKSASDDPRRTFRILVVDDHWKDWEPVFDIIKEELGKSKIYIEFNYSDDGISEINDGKNVLNNIVCYDLVILDIFLGRYDGRELLRKIRKTYLDIPVIIWTTSRDQEITKELAQVNGLILKKRTSKEEIERVILRWVEEGRCHRLGSLPNPFFNHVIKKYEYRKLIWDALNWCLKTMDAFHALDGDYFRYFTDHGGRHFVKISELLEHIIRPFLGDDSIFSEDAEKRQEEYTCLYLAVIGHELGMFPFKIEGKMEQFGNTSIEYAGYLMDVRALHALRGMILIEDDTNNYWSDDLGAGIGKKIHTLGLSNRLAVLIGYHARFLKSLKTNTLEWNPETKSKYENKITNEKFKSMKWDEKIAHSIERLKNNINEENDRKRLLNCCALLRFADAIDIDKSRNPANFIIFDSRKKPDYQYVQLVKRLVCDSIQIEDGKVAATISVQAPDASLLEKVIPGKYDKIDTSHPWSDEMITKWAEIDHNFYDEIDHWLKEVWQYLLGNRTCEKTLEYREFGILNENGLLNENGIKTICSMSAISIAGEVIDEYSAIREMNLNDKIKLYAFNWAQPEAPLPSDIMGFFNGFMEQL